MTKVYKQLCAYMQIFLYIFPYTKKLFILFLCYVNLSLYLAQSITAPDKLRRCERIICMKRMLSFVMAFMLMMGLALPANAAGLSQPAIVVQPNPQNSQNPVVQPDTQPPQGIPLPPNYQNGPGSQTQTDAQGNTLFQVMPQAQAVSNSRAVLGADLTEEQIYQVYQMFGVLRGQTYELTVTNAEERAYLEGYVDPAVIGTRSISCVYVELLPAGSGLDLRTNNITWCSPEMYISALNTAGITDARVVVAAPVAVSGTAGLTGVYKAYEDITGQTLSNEAKDAGTRELTITGLLGQQIGQLGSSSIIQELKQILDQTKYMSDEEIRATIESIASRYNVTLTNTQYQQLISLCRSLEGLDGDAISQRVDSVQDTIGKVAEAKDKIVGFVESIKKLVATLQDIVARLELLFGNISQ